jgi:hypothetical protein
MSECMHVHAAPGCARMIRARAASSPLYQAFCRLSRPGKRTTACHIFVSARTRCDAGETGAHAVIVLCKGCVGAAFARVDHPTVWHVMLPRMACSRTRCPRPSRVRPPRGPGAQSGADGLPPIPQHRGEASAAAPFVSPARAVRIPMIPATQSGAKLPPNPKEGEHGEPGNDAALGLSSTSMAGCNPYGGAPPSLGGACMMQTILPKFADDPQHLYALGTPDG